MVQAEKLTDEQIDQTYFYFEEPYYGRESPPAPKGVVLAETFSKTMGRLWDCNKQRFVRV